MASRPDGATRGTSQPPEEGEELLPPDTEVTSTLFRAPKSVKTRESVWKIGQLIRKHPVILAIAIFVAYMIIGWFGYVYHVINHRYFGAFTPHEKALCRDEGMMLYVQRVMWARAKGEIANIITDDKKNEYYGISRKHASEEVLKSHALEVEEAESADATGQSKLTRRKSGSGVAADPYSTAKVERETVHVKKIMQHRHKMKNLHADNFSPGVPKTNFAKKKSHIHRQRKKAIKKADLEGDDNAIGIQHHLNYIDVRTVNNDPLTDSFDEAGSENAQLDPLNPYSRVRVTSDMGFYQHSFGTVDVATVSTTNILGQSLSTYNTGNGFSTVVYYRIWKNANDYIRGLLYQFAQKKKVMDGETPHCVNLKDCAQQKGGKGGASETMPGERLKSLFFPAALRRFPFTFVRDPLSRFISGYTEIEYRYDLAARNNQKLGLPAGGTPGLLGGEVDPNSGAPILPGSPRATGRPGIHYEDTRNGGQVEWFLNRKGQKVKKNKGIGSSATVKVGGERSKGTARDKDRRRKPGTQGIDNVVKTEREARMRATADGRTSTADELVDGDMYGIVPPTAHDPIVQQTQLLKVMPLRHPLGSVLRFTEFVDLVLHYDGSRRLFRTYDNNHEMAHIAPQIGSLIAAAVSEALPMRMFRLEDFSKEWKRLVKETAQPRLGEVRDAVKNHTKLWQHPSSDDVHKTTLAANELLQKALGITAEVVVADITSGRLEKQEKEAWLYDREIAAAAGENAAGNSHFQRHHLSITSRDEEDPSAFTLKKEGKRSMAETAELVQRARQGMPHELLRLPHYRSLEVGYLRAICRIYVSDYVCADYELPYVCHDLHSELEELESQWEAAEDVRYRKHGGGMSLMHALLPHWLLYAIAEIPCTLLSTSPPTCIAMFVHGNHLYDDLDDHEEL